MSRKQVMVRAARYGATVEESRGMIYVDAPARQVWEANGCHVLAAAYEEGEKQHAWRDLLERMDYGLEPCQDAECDTCGPLEALKSGPSRAEKSG
jgi:hypothetical protein